MLHQRRFELITAYAGAGQGMIGDNDRRLCMDYDLISKLPVSAQETELIAQEIFDGKYGKDGDFFFSTKALAEKRAISLVTAHKVLTALCDKGVIELCGKKYRLTYEKQKKKLEQKHKIIGLHINNINNEYFARIANEAELYAKKNGYRLLICESGYDHEREREILEMFCDLKIMGVLSCPGVGDNTKSLYENYPLPYFFIGRTPKYMSGPSVQANNFPVSVQVANHFVKSGYSDFAYACLSEVDTSEDLRLFGYKSGLFSLGYELKQKNILPLHIKNIEQTHEAIKAFLSRVKKPVGILCYHDLIALEVYKTCVEMKLRIPEDVGIAGFDNLKDTRCTVPEITTVDYRLENMVSSSFYHLLKQIRTGKQEKINYFIEPRLIIRGSSSLNISQDEK